MDRNLANELIGQATWIKNQIATLDKLGCISVSKEIVPSLDKIEVDIPRLKSTFTKEERKVFYDSVNNLLKNNNAMDTYSDRTILSTILIQLKAISSVKNMENLN